MGRMRRTLLAIALLIALAIAGWILWPRPREPVYNGRTLSAWIQRLPASGYDTRGVTYKPLYQQKSGDELEAEAALQQIGTNALPFNDPQCHVRMAATNALRVLFPDEAAKAGITEK